MPILSFSTHRDFASWLVWLLVLVSILLIRGCVLPDVVTAGYPTDIWQSPGVGNSLVELSQSG